MKRIIHLGLALSLSLTLAAQPEGTIPAQSNALDSRLDSCFNDTTECYLPVFPTRTPTNAIGRFLHDATQFGDYEGTRQLRQHDNNLGLRHLTISSDAALARTHMLAQQGESTSLPDFPEVCSYAFQCIADGVKSAILPQLSEADLSADVAECREYCPGSTNRFQCNTKIMRQSARYEPTQHTKQALDGVASDMRESISLFRRQSERAAALENIKFGQGQFLKCCEYKARSPEFQQCMKTVTEDCRIPRAIRYAAAHQLDAKHLKALGTPPK